jgi:hypothetical protein
MAHGPREGSVRGGPMTAATRELTGVLAPRRLWSRGLAMMALGERWGSGSSHHGQKMAGE